MVTFFSFNFAKIQCFEGFNVGDYTQFQYADPERLLLLKVHKREI
jgi:hypothetical protein